MDREALGTYKGVFKHMGVLGHQGGVQMHGGIQTYGGVQMPPNIWGVKSMPPKCKSYMPPKKIRVFEHMGMLGASGGHPNAWVASKHMGGIWTVPAVGRGDLGNTWQLL